MGAGEILLRCICVTLVLSGLHIWDMLMHPNCFIDVAHVRPNPDPHALILTVVHADRFYRFVTLVSRVCTLVLTLATTVITLMIMKCSTT
jgi:hypothetical protein